VLVTLIHTGLLACLKNAIGWLSPLTPQPFAASRSPMFGARAAFLAPRARKIAAPNHGVPHGDRLINRVDDRRGAGRFADGN